MRNLKNTFLTTLLAVIVALSSNHLYAQGNADIIIYNAKVHTMDENNTTAEAIALKGNKNSCNWNKYRDQ